MIGISASLAACLCFWNVCANVHCVNACVCFEANKYSSSRPTSSGGRCRDAVWHAGKLLWVQAALDGAVQSYDLFTVVRKVNSVESRQCRPAAWFICCGVRAETANTRVTWQSVTLYRSLASAAWIAISQPCDASTPALETMGTECIWSRLTFATGFHFFYL